MEFKLLDKLWEPSSSKLIKLTFEIAINESRLQKYLWVEILINPEFAGLIKTAVSQVKASDKLKESFVRALSWYMAYKCSIFIENPNEVLDETLEYGPLDITGNLLKISRQEYTLHIRNLLKGLQCINYI